MLSLMDLDSQDRSRSWNTRKEEKDRRLANVKRFATGHLLDSERIVDVLENLLAPGDRVALEGDNQKQADFLSRALVRVDPSRIHDLICWARRGLASCETHPRSH